MTRVLADVADDKAPGVTGGNPIRFRAGSRVKLVFVTVLVGVLAILVLLPIAWLVIASSKDQSALFRLGAFSLPSHFVLWSTIVHAFRAQGGILRYWLFNTFLYAISISIGSTYLSALAGYAITKLSFPGKRVFTAVTIGSLMVPSAVLVLPLFILEAKLHLVNSYAGVILPSLLSAFGVFFMMVYFAESLPDALIDAALVDGASHWKVFHRIALPMAKPGIVTLVLILFIASWNNYFLPLVLLSNQRLFPVTVGLSIWSNTIQSTVGASSGLAYPDVIVSTLLSIAPTLLAFPFLQSFVAGGMTLGSLAGE